MEKATTVKEAWAAMKADGPAAPLPAAEPGQPENETPFQVGEEMFLGEVLLGAGMITNAALEKAMHEHHFTGKNIGQALLEAGDIDEDKLAQGIELQATLRGVAGLQ